MVPVGTTMCNDTKEKVWGQFPEIYNKGQYAENPRKAPSILPESC